MVDVGGGHAEGLGARGPELGGQVVVADAHVDGVAGADDAGGRGGDSEYDDDNDNCDGDVTEMRRG